MPETMIVCPRRKPGRRFVHELLEISAPRLCESMRNLLDAAMRIQLFERNGQPVLPVWMLDNSARNIDLMGHPEHVL